MTAARPLAPCSRGPRHRRARAAAPLAPPGGEAAVRLAGLLGEAGEELVHLQLVGELARGGDRDRRLVPPAEFAALDYSYLADALTAKARGDPVPTLT
jgi:hypothetical protein